MNDRAAPALTRLRDLVRGQLILPNDPGYDGARRVWNAMIDRRPAAIVRPVGAADVLAAVRFAREHSLPIAVRGGGHNVAGNGTVEGGLVIDLCVMKGIRVDPPARTVRVGPGVVLGELDRETEPFGLAVPTGVVSATGLAGLTLGGGVGWLTRRYGLTIDSLLSVDVVTAEGRLLTTSEKEEGDLFWGIRGGGGNFGIVTSFEFRAYPLAPTVFAGAVMHRQTRWVDALHFYADWKATVPDELTTIVSFLALPPSWVPAELQGETLMIVGFAWAGADPAAGERVVAPLRAFGPPALEVVEPIRWVAWQSSVDEIFPRGVRAYWKNASFDRLDDATIEVITEGARRITSKRTGIDIHQMGGAVLRVPEEATAFPNRAARYWLNLYSVWDDPADDAQGKAWARQVHAAMQPHSAPGMYVNFLGAEGGDVDARGQALAAYGPHKLARLVALKDRYDPENAFRLNHNIPPSR